MNNFNHISELKITVSNNSKGNTIVKDQYFTSPFKIMKPFPRNDGGICIYQQTASAGIMAGDEQIHTFKIEKGATLELVSQSFEKIFKMEENEKAIRKINAIVDENGTFIYTPLPCMPFGGSNFESQTKISLKNETSRLIYADCICCGRKAHGEEFDYRSYKNLVEIWQETNGSSKLIYRDNTIFEGSDCGKYPAYKEFLKSSVMYGDYSHSGTLLLFNFNIRPALICELLGLESKLLYTAESLELNKKNAIPLISYTLTEGNGIAIRILAYSAEQVQNLFNKICNSELLS